MNNIIDDTTFTSDAIQGTTLQVVSPGKLAVSAGGITSNELASNSVVTAKIADANVTPAKLSQPLTSATAQNSTSGTSIDFTSIPSWVKRVTVMFDGVSTNGTSPVLVQIGDSNGIEVTGYNSASQYGVSAGAGQLITSTAGLILEPTGSLATSTLRYGSMIVSALGSNTWVEQSGIYSTSAGTSVQGSGAKTLSGTLDRVRITTVNGTDTFDAGSVNIMYE
jgi:hypothetical protein